MEKENKQLKTDSIISTFLLFIDDLHRYFNLDSSYFIWKIKTLLFPYIKYDCTSNQIENNSRAALLQPDLRYPELFLPLLSFFLYTSIVTYIHLYQGFSSPDIAISQMIKNACLVVLQGLVIKTYFLFWNSSCIYFINVIAYSSNKFLVLCLCVITAKIDYVKYFAIIYAIMTNVKNFQACYSSHYRKNNMTDIILSIIEIAADVIVIIDLY